MTTRSGGFGAGRRWTPSAPNDPVPLEEFDNVLGRKASRASVEELDDRLREMEAQVAKISKALGL